MTAARTAAETGGAVDTNNYEWSSPKERRHVEMVVSLYDEVFNKRDVDAVDKYFTGNFRQHNPLYGAGATGFKGFTREFWLSNFPDLNVNVEVAFAQNDRVLSFCTWTGTQAGTGKPLRVLVADIYRFWDGKMAEHWDVMEYTELAPFGVVRPTMWQPSSPIDRGGTPAQQENVRRLLKYLEEVPIQDLSLAHKYIAEDFQQFDPTVIDEGLEGFKACFAGFRPFAPDLAVAPDNIVAGTDYVGAIWNSYGHYPETGDKFIMPTCDLYRVKDGMFVKHWGLVDYTDIVALLGFNPKKYLKAQRAQKEADPVAGDTT